MNILLVDDHAVVRLGYAGLLRDGLPGVVVREAASGEEALARVHEAVPNLVIIGFGLPGISGLETTRRLRQRLPQLRVLFFSQHAELPVVRQALDAGACSPAFRVCACTRVNQVAAASRTLALPQVQSRVSILQSWAGAAWPFSLSWCCSPAG